eukprot:gnl/MRDRNA2_/MRDRNA2_87619_c0_seq1.p1 gnl/MRDRNA2_/MRDRNA2_87619_c0~~gnl/MRDRNA2_/MRDRNA2_87619_c0_seq1.p1  ORF type:complete len:711 (+),score=195.40 gnl/MRDRNA2_/MRDRNA2_87619_c0_seq1:91-2223(+)
MKHLLVAVTLFVAAVGKPRRHARQGDSFRKFERGYGNLQQRIEDFENDMKEFIGESKKMDPQAQRMKATVGSDVHELRKLFDDMDTGMKEKAPKVVKKQHHHHRRNQKQVVQSKKFDRSHWENLKHFWQPDLPNKAANVPKELTKEQKAARHVKQARKLAHSRHQRPAFREMSEVPMEMGSRKCGSQIPASEMGLKQTEAVEQVFGSFLQANASGPGGDQQLAEGGAAGSLDGQEVMLETYKDGFFLTGCAADAMFTYGDKFGGNKFKYKMSNVDVSIVLYEEMVDSADHQPMTPKVCFEFCQTVPTMGYFGLIHGRTCYCMPYWKPSAEGSGKCDLPCEGDPTTMCGGDEKTSLYEMHSCEEPAAALFLLANDASHVLMYFYQNARQLKRYDEETLRAGKKLEQVASDSDDPVADDLGIFATKTYGEGEKLLNDVTCVNAYTELLTQYNEAQLTKGLDMSATENHQRSDAALKKLHELIPLTEGCATKAQDFNVGIYPWHVEFLESLGDADGGKGWWESHLAQAKEASHAYRPLSALAGKSTSLNAMTTCSGNTIGVPKVAGYNECALACDETQGSTSCVGFQHFRFSGTGNGQKALCFLFSKFDSLTEYDCDESDGTDDSDSTDSSFLQRTSPTQLKHLVDSHGQIEHAACTVKPSSFRGVFDLELKESSRCFFTGADASISDDLTSHSTGAKDGVLEIEEPTLWTDE